MTTTRRLSAAAACAVLALCGCSPEAGDAPDASPTSAAPGAPVVQLAAPGEDNRTLSPEEVEGLTEPGHTAADAAFVKAMLPHHQQALEMTALVDGRTASRGVPLLAERIELSQDQEIDQLERWLTERGEAVSGEHDGGGHADHSMMPGMMTSAEMARLRAAEGPRFDRMFLGYMIRHHEGAIRMVEELLAGGGGLESETFQLAAHIESDQQVEIARMRQMLADSAS